MAAVVAHVAGFIGALGLKDVHLVGQSRGGYVSCRTTLDHPELIKTCVIIDSGTLAPGTGRMAEVMANPPEPRLTKDSQRWVLERYSFGYGHIDDEWLDALAAVAATPEYRQAVSDVAKSPLVENLAKQKAETLAWIADPDRGMGKPTLLIWSYNDPTATIAQGHALFELIAKGESRARMHIFNESDHFTYREHPEEFTALLRSGVANNS